MAPEQARGDNLDHRADLFSLGCVLYSLLSGELPFEGSTLMAVLYRLANEIPRPITEKVPSVPAPLADLISALLAKKPEDRPASAAIVAARLAEIEPLCPNVDAPLHDPVQIGLSIAATPSPHQAHTLPNLDQRTILQSSRFLDPACARGPTRRQVLFGAVRLLWEAQAGCIYRSLGGRNGGSPAGGVPTPSGEPIVVGILHSETGDLRDNEVPVIQMTQLAFDEINEVGWIARPAGEIHHSQRQVGRKSLRPRSGSAHCPRQSQCDFRLLDLREP